MSYYAPTAPHRSPARTIAAGLVSLLGILTVLFAVPAALWFFGGSPVPDAVPTFDQVRGALSSVDDGTLVIGTLKYLGWAAWLSLALSILLELPAQVADVRVPRLPGLSWQQGRAAAMTGAVAAMIALIATGGVATAYTAAAAETAAPTSPAPTAAPHPGAATWVEAATPASVTPGPQQATPKPAPPTRPVTKTVTVKSGDTLWGIAHDTLGKGSRYPELAKASRNTIQPGGRHLRNPDLIYPGWKITVPTKANPANPAPSPGPTPAPSTSSTTATPRAGSSVGADQDKAAAPARATTDARTSSQAAPQSGARQTAPGATATPRDHPSVAAAGGSNSASTATPRLPSPPLTAANAAVDADPTNTGRVVATVTGLGALAAAGLLLVLRRRRSEQTRRRRPGRRIALPKGQAAIAEAQLRAAADPIAIEDLDRSLRTLAGRASTLGQPMPSIRAVRLAAEEIELYLADDVELPAPFARVEGADATWTLARGDIETAMLTTEEAAGIPAPCPTMVTVGHDQDDAHVLVNLEEIGSLGVTGDEQLSREVLTGLTLELIVSPWADTIDVALVGVMRDYAAVQPDLCHYVDDVEQLLLSLEHDAGVNARGLQEADIAGPTQARAAQVLESVWVPRLVVVGVPLTERQSARLSNVVQHVPRLAVAALTSETDPLGEWSLSVQPGHPHPTGALGVGADPVPVRPQYLSAEDYQAVVAAFAATHEADEDGPEWASSITDEPIDISTVVVSNLETTSADVDAPADTDPQDDLELDPSTTAAFEETTSAPERPAEVTEVLMTHATDMETDTTRAAEVSRVGKFKPMVRLLGPIEIIDPPGPKPSSPAKCRELIAYLALHPGHGHEALDAAIYPGERVLANRRNGLMRQARAWLGTFDDGRPRLPHATGGVYKLDEENSVDRWRFEKLIGDDLAATPTPSLKAALELTDGQPMTYPEADRYAFADTAKMEILDAVADVAYELARRSIASGDPQTAEWAASKGLDAQPTNEALWRVSITAAYQSGRPGRAQEVITRCHQQLDPDDSDLHPETQDLINQVTDRQVPVHA